MLPRIFKKIIVLAPILLFGCQDILECVINRHPELQDKRLNVGNKDQIYYDFINAQIKNEPLDDSYDYYFHISDNLPPGLEVFVDFRTIVIEGVPEAAGTYHVDVSLRVQQYDYYYDNCENQFNNCDGLCSETTSRTYTLRVL